MSTFYRNKSNYVLTKGDITVSNLGFSITDLLVTLGILGILITAAHPIYSQFMVYARRAEAKNNLAHIVTLQSSYHTDKAAYVPLGAVGYTGSGASVCSGSAYDNALGFRPDGCSQLRYEYSTNVNGQEFEAFAYGRSDFNRKWIYPECRGTGVTQYGKSQGDLLTIAHDKEIEVCRDITEYCPKNSSTGSAASKCGTPLVAGTSTPTNTSVVSGITPTPFKSLSPDDATKLKKLNKVKEFHPIENRSPYCEAYHGDDFPTGILGGGNEYSYHASCGGGDCMTCDAGGATVVCYVGCGNAPKDTEGKCSCSSAHCVSEASVEWCNTVQDPVGKKCIHRIALTTRDALYKKSVKVNLSSECR